MHKLLACKLLIIAGVMKTIGETDLTNSSEIHSILSGRRIIAGYQSMIAWVPYYIYVSLRDDNILRTCGGSIISRRWIITAAHCMYRQRRRIPDDKVLLYAGTGNSDILDDTVQMKHVIFSMVHRDWINPYGDQISNHDIALLKTCTSLEYTSEVQPILPAPRNYALPDGIKALACGFGDTSSFGPAVRSTDLYAVVLRKRRCWGKPSQTVICFEGIHSPLSGICHGDSGGPLMYLDNTTPVLIGVASGTGCKINVGGGSFTDVSLYRDWIRAFTGI